MFILGEIIVVSNYEVTGVDFGGHISILRPIVSTYGTLYLNKSPLSGSTECSEASVSWPRTGIDFGAWDDETGWGLVRTTSINSTMLI